MDSFKHTIYSYPSSAIFSYSPIAGCSSLTVNFHVATEGLVQYFWDFGDGNTVFTTTPDVVNVYQDPGNFVPKVILTDSVDCKTPLIGNDTIHLTKSLV